MIQSEFVLSTPWPTWRLLIAVGSDDILHRVQFVSATNNSVRAEGCPPCIAAEFQRYFANPNYQINLPLARTGSVFEQKVRQALLDIPSGQTVTYGELAQRIGSAARAVGGACRRNPYPLIVPCHRVVGRNGLGGFVGASGGSWLALKSNLLAHEHAIVAAA